MFQRGSFLLSMLGVLLVIGLLVGAGSMVFQAGQAQGYAAGLAAAGKELPLAPPYYGYGPIRPYFFPFLPGFGLFFGFIPVILILFLIGGMFRRFAWGRQGRHGYWPGGPHDPSWGPPPWSRDQTTAEAEKKAAPPPPTPPAG